MDFKDIKGALGILSSFIPQLAAVEKIITLAEFAINAGKSAKDQVDLLKQLVVDKQPLTPAQSAKLEAEFERVHASIQRPLDPPPGSG